VKHPREWQMTASELLREYPDDVQGVTVLFAESVRYERDVDGTNVVEESAYYHVTAKRFDGTSATGRDPDFSKAVEILGSKLKAHDVEGDDA